MTRPDWTPQLGLTAALLRTEQLANSDLILLLNLLDKDLKVVVFQIFYRNKHQQIHHVYNEPRIVSRNRNIK